jgi:hypothetical protein
VDGTEQVLHRIICALLCYVFCQGSIITEFSMLQPNSTVTGARTGVQVSFTVPQDAEAEALGSFNRTIVDEINFASPNFDTFYGEGSISIVDAT